jgi:hypothetical protein
MKHEMRRAKLLLAAALLPLFFAPVPARSQENESSPAPGFQSYRIVVDRNIFDPDRRASRPERRSTPTEPLSQPEELAVTGVLIHDGAAVAFFEGTTPEYSVDLKEGGTIVGYTVVEIRTDRLRISKNGREVELPVGSGLSRQHEGEWELASAPSFLDRRELSSSEKSNETKSRDSSSTDLLERLRRRREREIGR